jgi:hypothetical protein
MHMQIRTSPYAVGQNVRRAAAALAAGGVNVEGIGPDYESPHARIVVPHEAFEAARKILREAGFDPEPRHACTFALPHRPGQLAAVLERVAEADFDVESVLVLASRLRGMTLVSIGVDREPTAEERERLGCVDEPAGWIGGDIVEPTAG